MALNNTKENSNNQKQDFKPADAWLQLSIETSLGRKKVSKKDIAIFADTVVGRTLINATMADETAEFKLVGRVYIPDTTPIDEQPDLVLV